MQTLRKTTKKNHKFSAHHLSFIARNKVVDVPAEIEVELEVLRARCAALERERERK